MFADFHRTGFFNLIKSQKIQWISTAIKSGLHEKMKTFTAANFLKLHFHTKIYKTFDLCKLISSITCRGLVSFPKRIKSDLPRALLTLCPSITLGLKSLLNSFVIRHRVDLFVIESYYIVFISSILFKYYSMQMCEHRWSGLIKYSTILFLAILMTKTLLKKVSSKKEIKHPRTSIFNSK